jgi:hypothetical protein
MDKTVKLELNKLASAQLCSSVLGQGKWFKLI